MDATAIRVGYTPLHDYSETYSMKQLSDRELVDLIDKAITGFRGNTERLSNAIGFLMIGRKLGWRVMYLMHDRKSIRNYEKILGIDSRTIFLEYGPLANKSIAYIALQKVTNFWKAVKGEIPGVRSQEMTK